MTIEYLVLIKMKNHDIILKLRKKGAKVDYIENLEIRRIYNGYKHKDYFFDIGIYKEQNKIDDEIKGLLIEKGFPIEEIEDGIVEFEDFIKILKEKKLI